MKLNSSSTELKLENTEKRSFFDKYSALSSMPAISCQFKSKSFDIQPKNIKKNTKESFEKHLAEIDEFDSYIEKQYSKMLQQKTQNPTLMIPGGFKKFVHSKLFHNFIQRLYDYMDILIQYQKKFNDIKQITATFQPTKRYEPTLKKLKYEASHLQQKCKQVSYVYMGILLSQGESKLIFKDQYFFQTMIYFTSQILKSVFDQEDHPLIQQELNRIFRTNAFNLIKRRQDEDNAYQKYPSLKQAKYDSSPHGISRIIKRLSIQKKFNYSIQIKSQNLERLKKPLQINLSPLGSVKSRSPLISSFYPSSKQKLFEFGKNARNKEELIKQVRVSNTFFYRK